MTPRHARGARAWPFGLMVLALSLDTPSAFAADSSLLIFLRVEGEALDWQAVTLEVKTLQVSGLDPQGQRFSSTAFDGSTALTVLRAAKGANRFLVRGTSPEGRVDQIAMTVGSVTMSTSGPGGSPRQVPVVVKDNLVLLRPARPLQVSAGETRAFVIPLRLGVDAVLTAQQLVALRPVLGLEAYQGTPAAEAYLNGAEVLRPGLVEDLPELGLRIGRSKVLDPATGGLRDLTLQLDTGAPVSFSELRSQNEAAWRSRHGALGPQLVRELAGRAPSDLVEVEVWLNAPGPSTLTQRGATLAAWEAAHAAFVAERRAAAEPLIAQTAAELAAAGATILRTEIHPAVLHLLASRAVIEGVVARKSAVLEVAGALARVEDMATMGGEDLIQRPLHIRQVPAPFFSLPAPRVAITESTGCVNTEHEAFSEGMVVFEEPIVACTEPQMHPTVVTGAVASWVPEWSSADPNQTRPPPGFVGALRTRVVMVENCGPTDSTLARDPELINVSCIHLRSPYAPENELRRPIDHAVYADRVFVAKAAGNLGFHDDPQYYDTAFCNAYNALCVGGYHHNYTPGPAHVADDVVPSGCWRNAGPLNREKPDLVGPYAARLPRWESESQSPSFLNRQWELNGGTSISTPLVLGTAAILMSIFPATLAGDPTLLRAVLMASAFHSFPGYPRVPLFGDAVDDPAGAGAPRGDRALEIIDHHRFYSASVERTADFDAAGDLRTAIAFDVERGDRVRIVLTYDQCQATTIGLDDALQADIDLVVFEQDDGGINLVHANNSHVDNTEIIDVTVGEFSPSTAPGLRMVVRPRVQHWDPCSDGSRRTYLSIAWDVVPGSDLPPSG